MDLFGKNPDNALYLHQIRKKLGLSAGNIRRELLSLTKLGLFTRIKQGRLIFYKINKESPFFNMIESNKVYCQTRDVFQVRLDSFIRHLENELGNDAYLLGAVAGEIGNNSFDHNLGNRPETPGVYFDHDGKTKTIVLTDRGRGIFTTIKNVRPETKTDKEALLVAFTKIISGRSPEQRGNGLKFVTRVLRDKKWQLNFKSGQAVLTINHSGKMKIKNLKRNVPGCFAVIKYYYET